MKHHQKIINVFFFFLWPHLQHVEVPRLGVKSVITAGLHHSHSKTRFEPHLRTTLQLVATLDPYPLSSGMKPASSQDTMLGSNLLSLNRNSSIFLIQSIYHFQRMLLYINSILPHRYSELIRVKATLYTNVFCTAFRIFITSKFIR